MSGDALAQLPMEVLRNQGDVAPRAVGTAGWVGVALGDPRAFFPTQMIRWCHHDRFLPLADRIQAAFCQLQKQNSTFSKGRRAISCCLGERSHSWPCVRGCTNLCLYLDGIISVSARRWEWRVFLRGFQMCGGVNGEIVLGT